MIRRFFKIATRILTIALVASRATYDNLVYHSVACDDAEEATELADIYSKLARNEIEKLFWEAKNNEDELNYPTAHNILDGLYWFLELGIENPIE